MDGWRSAKEKRRTRMRGAMHIVSFSFLFLDFIGDWSTHIYVKYFNNITTIVQFPSGLQFWNCHPRPTAFVWRAQNINERTCRPTGDPLTLTSYSWSILLPNQGETSGLGPKSLRHSNEFGTQISRRNCSPWESPWISYRKNQVSSLSKSYPSEFMRPCPSHLLKILTFRKVRCSCPPSSIYSLMTFYLQSRTQFIHLSRTPLSD